MVLAGEDITAERVKDLLRAQINSGLVPVQDALSQSWNAANERAKEKIMAGLEAHGSHAIPVYETDR